MCYARNVGRQGSLITGWLSTQKIYKSFICHIKMLIIFFPSLIFQEISFWDSKPWCKADSSVNSYLARFFAILVNDSATDKVSWIPELLPQWAELFWWLSRWEYFTIWWFFSDIKSLAILIIRVTPMLDKISERKLKIQKIFCSSTCLA